MQRRNFFNQQNSLLTTFSTDNCPQTSNANLSLPAYPRSLKSSSISSKTSTKSPSLIMAASATKTSFAKSWPAYMLKVSKITRLSFRQAKILTLSTSSTSLKSISSIPLGCLCWLCWGLGPFLANFKCFIIWPVGLSIGLIRRRKGRGLGGKTARKRWVIGCISFVRIALTRFVTIFQNIWVLWE